MAVGFVGAYATISTFEYETARLIEERHLLLALLNVPLSVVVGFVAVWGGIVAARKLEGAPALSGAAYQQFERLADESDGDAVYFSGPKMGHMAVRQAEVAAENLAAELEGREPPARYNHEMTLVIDEGGKESAYLHRDLWEEDDGVVGHGRFWGWAKRAQEKYFTALHS